MMREPSDQNTWLTVFAVNDLDTAHDQSLDFDDMAYDAGAAVVCLDGRENNIDMLYFDAAWQFRIRLKDVTLRQWCEHLSKIWHDAVGDVEMNVQVSEGSKQLCRVNLVTYEAK
jgi:hypothetical protein